VHHGSGKKGVDASRLYWTCSLCTKSHRSWYGDDSMLRSGRSISSNPQWIKISFSRCKGGATVWIRNESHRNLGSHTSRSLSPFRMFCFLTLTMLRRQRSADRIGTSWSSQLNGRPRWNDISDKHGHRKSISVDLRILSQPQLVKEVENR